MKAVFACVLGMLLGVAAPNSALARGEHLEPVAFISHAGVRDYTNKVFALLHSGFVAMPQARCTVLPSFTPEYAWSVERRPEGSYLRTNIMAENYWYAKSKDVPVLSRSIRLEPELASAVEELFRAAVDGIRVAEKDGLGLDGVSYYPAAVGTNGAWRTGTVWSPPKESPMGRLAQISDDLFALAEGKGPSQAELAERCRSLLGDLRGR